MRKLFFLSFLALATASFAQDDYALDARKVAELRAEAKASKDPFSVWQEAVKIESTYIRDAAAWEIGRLRDPRLLPLLDELAKQKDSKFNRAVYDRFPAYADHAASIATYMRSEEKFNKIIADTPKEKLVSRLLELYKGKDNFLSALASSYVYNLPATEEVIDFWMQDICPGVEERLMKLDEPLYSKLYKIILETNDDKAIEMLANVFRKRKDKNCLPVLLKAFDRTIPNTNNYWQFVVGQAIADFGDEILPELESRWLNSSTAFRRKVLAISCQRVSTQKSFALIVKWHRRD